MGVCQGLAGWQLCQALRKAPLHGVSQVVLRIDQCVGLESPHEERAQHHRQRHRVIRPSGNVMFQSTLNSKPKFLEPVPCKYENAVMDYIVEGGVTLRAAGGICFKKFVVSLTNRYEPSSTRTILSWSHCWWHFCAAWTSPSP
ncbi:unnamed protein product [Sphagnum jensenii]|uniref:Uncharacterized protein n=1 Tax=Sphagnum jensenii TaxID=128206 RepID=A0ABP1BM17_9BRYO